MKYRSFQFNYNPVLFVGASKATNPRSTVTDVNGVTSLKIPVPSGIGDGDLLIAAVILGPTNSGTFTAPSGWTVWLDPTNQTNPRTGVYYKFATPADYNSVPIWTTSAAKSLSGLIVAYRDALPGYLAMQTNPVSPPGDNTPVTTPDYRYSTLLSGNFRLQVDATRLGEDMTASPPLTLLAQHVTGDGLTNGVHATLAHEESLPANTVISGRHITDAEGSNGSNTRLLTILIRRRTADAPTVPVVVGSSKASTPASGTNPIGDTIVIPLPTGVKADDLLFACTRETSGSGQTTGPAGWTRLLVSTVFAVWYRKASTSEPTSYTWTVTALAANGARTGCMIAVRGGQVTVNLGAVSPTTLETTTTGISIANLGVGASVCPVVTTRAQPGAMFLGFVGRTEADDDEDFTVTGPHVLQVQHVSGVAAVAALSSAISAQVNIPAHTILNTNAFVDAESGGNRRCASVIVEPI